MFFNNINDTGRNFDKIFVNIPTLLFLTFYNVDNNDLPKRPNGIK